MGHEVKRMNIWFCASCLADQEGSVWDGYNKEDGHCYCKKCRPDTPCMTLENGDCIAEGCMHDISEAIE